MTTATPRTGKFVDGKDQTLWPIHGHVGWYVQTAGRVDLDLVEPKSSAYNQSPKRYVPAGTRLLLKDIDQKNNAYLYDYDYGVMMMPVELLEPLGK